MVLTTLIIFHIFIVLILMFPIPKGVAFALCGFEAVLLIVFAVDVAIGLKNVLKRKSIIDNQIFAVMMRIQVFHVVATALAVILFILGIVEIITLSMDDRYGTLSGGRMFT